MTFYLYEGDVRNDSYTADSVIGVVRRIADLYKLDLVEHQFAGDVIVYDDARWQSLLDDYRYDPDEPDAIDAFLEMHDVPANIPDDKLLLYVCAYRLEGPPQADARDVYKLISTHPDASEIERVFSLLLPDHGYRILEDAY